DRGTAIAPADRYPSMAALVAALSRTPRALSIAGVSVGIGVAVAAVLLLARGHAPPACADVGGGARLRIDPATVGVPPAEAQAIRFARDAVAAWSADLADERRDACEATQVRGEQSAATEAARRRCLDAAAADAKVWTDALAAGDARVLARVDAVA